MNYKETLAFLYQQLPMFQRIGPAAYKADLSNTVALCERLGNPQLKFPAIHIAGTNGKGSVSHFIASILQEAGLKTGLFTSPHLKDFRERIRLNGAMIPEESVVRFVEKYKTMLQDINPSFFEYTFGMAMEHFAGEQVDLVVAETGMGGRLDSTNVLRPVLSVITNIGFDHTQFLGDTLPKIAVEKAGIIKTGVPVLVSEKQLEVEAVFTEKARELSADILFADSLFALTNDYLDEHGHLILTFENTRDRKSISVKSPLAGQYQVKNLKAVLAAIELLNSNGYRIPESAIQSGVLKVIENTTIRGRWEVLSEHPKVVCDTAHNKEGVKNIVDQISSNQYHQLHFVLGMVADKNIEDILDLLPKKAHYYFCKADIPRGMPAEELKARGSRFGLKGKVFKSVQEAYSAALKSANPDDLVFIGGSTFTVAEVL